MLLKDLKNQYDGERVFLLGNGPSLQRTPLNLLTDEYTFGVNNIANIFDQTEWRPSFYMANHSPPGVPAENVLEVVELDVPCFLPANDLAFVPDRENVHWLPLERLADKKSVAITSYNIDWESIDYQEVWSRDVSEVVYNHSTVLYPAMQIVDYMGFSEIYLLGCDLYDEWDLHMVFGEGADPAIYNSEYESKIRRIYDFISSSEYPLRSFVNGIAYHVLDSNLFRKTQPYLMSIDDRFANPGHFYDTYDLSQYLAGNQLRNEKMIRSHRLAKVVSAESNFTIYNATLGGYLEVHPRVDLEEVLDRTRLTPS